MSSSFEKRLKIEFGRVWNIKKANFLIIKYTNLLSSSYVDILSPFFDDCYHYVSNILGIRTEKKPIIYLSSTTGNNINTEEIPWDSSIPHLNVAFINTSRSTRALRTNIIHELVHLLSYCWDKRIYHVEMLEEGLACYLSRKEQNLHRVYLNEMLMAFKKEGFCDFTLFITEKREYLNYQKAASFTKYLIERYGMSRFKKLYLASTVDFKGRLFMKNNLPIPKTLVYNLLNKVYCDNPIKIQIDWLNEVYIKGRRRKTNPS